MKRIFFKSDARLDEFSYFWPNSICILGMKSILVTAAGYIYPCETLYDQNELSIGHLTNGIDFHKISKITKEYINKSSILCKSCWAYRFCYQCFITAYTDEIYDQTLRVKECTATKNEIINDFKMFLSIIEKEPSAFNYLADMGKDDTFTDMTED